MADKKTKPRKKTKRGRPPMEFGPTVIDALDKYTGSGTVTDLCKYLAISNTVFYKWAASYDEFNDAVSRVRDRVDDEVENALLKRAKGFDYDEITERTEDGEQSKQISQIKRIHVAPDPGAAKHWLANRRPDKWRDKKILQVEGDHVELLEKALKGELD